MGVFFGFFFSCVPFCLCTVPELITVVYLCEEFLISLPATAFLFLFFSFVLFQYNIASQWRA